MGDTTRPRPQHQSTPEDHQPQDDWLIGHTLEGTCAVAKDGDNEAAQEPQESETTERQRGDGQGAVALPDGQSQQQDPDTSTGDAQTSKGVDQQLAVLRCQADDNLAEASEAEEDETPRAETAFGPGAAGEVEPEQEENSEHKKRGIHHGVQRRADIAVA